MGNGIAVDVIGLESLGHDGKGKPLIKDIDEEIQRMAALVCSPEYNGKAKGKITVVIDVMCTGSGSVAIGHSKNVKTPKAPPRDNVGAFVDGNKFVTRETRQEPLALISRIKGGE